jgi:transcriptional regulator of nitric oxide reductase
MALHAGRIGLFVAILLLIRCEHQQYRALRELQQAAPVPPAVLARFFPAGTQLGPWDVEHGSRSVEDAEGNTVGFVVQTSPTCDDVVGYLGPTNVLIAFDEQYQVLGIAVLESEDTKEHLEVIQENARFLQSYNGCSWQEAARLSDVEAVSGATLTSLAMIESISKRLGGACPSLRFPEPVEIRELEPHFPEAEELRERAAQPLIRDVFDAAGRRLGSVIRTSPTCDGMAGYQGPTDTLILLDPENRVKGLVVRSSYDNQPYVRYVQEDRYFCHRFDGMTLGELAALDLEEAEVEGVSGATFTSMAVARSLKPTAQAARIRRSESSGFSLTRHDFGTAAVLVAALLISWTHLRGKRWVQLGFRLLLVAYLGFINGDMLSQALLAGWAQSGVPWRLAPGLVLLTGAALVVPMFSKRQLYCQHICPFGAAQQLVRGRARWQWKMPARLQQLLSYLPPALLALVLLTALLHWPLNLAGIEPFNAFSVGIAGAATITVAVIGLAASCFVPMAYCRYGCPTGSMLDYLRYHGRSDRLSRRDLFAVGLLLLAILLSG